MSFFKASGLRKPLNARLFFGPVLLRCSKAGLRCATQNPYCPRMVNSYLTDFETATGLAPKEVAAVLGTAYSTYMLYRSTRRSLPPYIRSHLRTLLSIPAESRQPILDARRGK